MAQLNTVYAISTEVAFGDTGTALLVGSLPPNAQILRITATVSAAFDGTGTDLLEVGISTDANRYATALDLATAGNIAGTVLIRAVESTVAATQVYCTYTDANADAAAGAATVVLEYLQK